MRYESRNVRVVLKSDMLVTVHAESAGALALRSPAAIVGTNAQATRRTPLIAKRRRAIGATASYV